MFLSSRLASRSGTRQVEASLRADACALAADRAVKRIWRRLWLALKDQTAPWHARHLARAALAHLLPTVRVAVADSLFRVAKWGHRTARDNLERVLPTDHLRAAVLTEAVILDPAGVTTLTPDAERNELADLLFRTPSTEVIHRIVHAPSGGVSWEQRLAGATRFASPDQLAATVAHGFAAGKSQAEIARDLLPVVQGVRSSARRIARTEALRVAHEVGFRQEEELGDLVAAWQVHATLDQFTRPAHAARSGTIYWKRPKPGQLGLDQMPRPPLESDGSISWNCRCYLSPVLRPPSSIPPEVRVAFEDNAGKVVPDPVHYADWFSQVDDRRRQTAVGPRRYAALLDLLDRETPRWEHFLNVDGELLTIAQLRREGATARNERVAKVKALIAERRRLLVQAATWGFV